jgi:hypothetical protein
MSLRLVLRSAWFLLVILGSTCPNLLAQQSAQRPDSAPSDELNKDLPKWLRFSGEYRARLEGFTGGSFKPSNDDAYFLSRIRLNMKIEPADWLKLVVQGQDSRVWGKNQHPAAPPYQDIFDLRVGYIELGDAEKGSVAIRLGRQELTFGEQRLVGSADWLNTPRSFDAIRATFHVSGYRLDAFASSVVNQRDGKFDRSNPGNNLYGVYETMEKLVPGATVEPYFFWRRAPNLVTEAAHQGNLNFGTLGLRWAGKLPGHFDYGTEMAHQAGRLGTDRVGAWAGHWIVGYTVAGAWASPRLSVEFNHASGDDNPHDGRRGTFDQIYPTNHDRYGLTDPVGWKNLNHLRSGIEIKPRPKWLAIASYHSFWLANSHDGFYNASGALVARVPDGSAGRYVGQEADLQAVYFWSGRTKIGAGYGHLFPGTFLKKTTDGSAYTYPYAYVNYLF